MKDVMRECRKTKFNPKQIIKVLEYGRSLLATRLYTSQVNFVGEEAVDYGGPRREFWELVVTKGVEEYCVSGGESGAIFQTNSVALQVW